MVIINYQLIIKVERIKAVSIKEIPLNGLETDRILIRYYKPADTSDVYNMLSDDRVFEYLLDTPMKDLKLVEKYVKYASSERGRKAGRLIGIDKYTGRFIGTITTHPINADEIEIGFTLPVESWGKGYATELLKAITKYYHPYYKLTLRILEKNKSSQNVAKKSGYILTASNVEIKDDIRHTVNTYTYHKELGEG